MYSNLFPTDVVPDTVYHWVPLDSTGNYAESSLLGNHTHVPLTKQMIMDFQEIAIKPYHKHKHMW